MAFQSSVALQMAYGVQGEFAYDGPMRVHPWQLQSSPEPNVIGATAYTVVSEGIAMAGGTGVFAGILVRPKEYTYTGSVSTSTLTLPDDTVALLCTMGTLNLLLTTAGGIGDALIYDNTTGALASVVGTFSVTASFATNVMTVTGTPAGVIGPGTTIKGAGLPPGLFVTTLGSGTGGAGTYNLSETTGTVASQTNTGSNVDGYAGSGKTFVPRAAVVLRVSAANGLAICELTD
jgi:hypothetical protein